MEIENPNLAEEPFDARDNVLVRFFKRILKIKNDGYFENQSKEIEDVSDFIRKYLENKKNETIGEQEIKEISYLIDKFNQKDDQNDRLNFALSYIKPDKIDIDSKNKFFDLMINDCKIKENNQGFNVIHFAAFNNNIDLIKNILERYKISLKKWNSIHLAVMAGNKTIVKSIIDENWLLLNLRDYLGRTPLCVAVEYQQDEIAKFLIEKSCKIYKQTELKFETNDDDFNKFYFNSLYLALKSEEGELAKILIDKVERVDKEFMEDCTELKQAEFLKSILEEEIFVREGEKIFVKEGKEISVENDEAENLKEIAFYLNPNAKDPKETEKNNENEKNLKNYTELLKKIKSDQINEKNGVDESMKIWMENKYLDLKIIAIYFALVYWKKETAKKLIDKFFCKSNGNHSDNKNVKEENKNEYQEDNWRMKLFFFALEYHQNDFIKNLIDLIDQISLEDYSKKENFEDIDKLKKSILHFAITENNLNRVKDVFHNDTRNEVDYLGRTPLDIALQYKQKDIAKYLIDHGCRFGDKLLNLNLKDKKKMTPIHYAAMTGNLELVKLLVQNGVNRDVKDKCGKTALYLAHKYKRNNVTEYLKGKGCCTNDQLKENYQNSEDSEIKSTPLHLAAMGGALDVVKYLIENGANKEAKDYLGRTPLYIAAEYKQEEVVRYLIEQDCDPQAKNINGQKALYWIIAKCPEFATEVLDKYRDLNKYRFKDIYYLKNLEREPIFDRKECEGEGRIVYNFPNVKSILDLIVEKKNYDVVSHPVIQELISFKFDQNLWWFWGKFIIDLLFCIIWIVWAVLVPYDQRYLYTFPQDWWRIFLFLLGIIGLITMITFEIIEAIGQVQINNKIRTTRIKELEIEALKVLEENKIQRNFIKNEKCLTEKSWLSFFFKFYALNPWNILDIIATIFIFISLSTHLADIINHNDTIARNHIRITSLTILIISIRLLNSARILWEPLGILIMTLYYSVYDIFVWIFLFIITWIPFTAAFFILFGNGQKICNKEECLDEEKTVVGGMENFGKAMFFLYKTTFGIGDIDFEGYNKADSEMADFFFGIYVSFTTLILLNIFIALLSSTFNRLHSLSKSAFFIERAGEILTFEYFLSENKRIKLLFRIPYNLIKRYKPSSVSKSENKFLLDPLKQQVDLIKPKNECESCQKAKESISMLKSDIQKIYEKLKSQI